MRRERKMCGTLSRQTLSEASGGSTKKMAQCILRRTISHLSGNNTTVFSLIKRKESNGSTLCTSWRREEFLEMIWA